MGGPGKIIEADETYHGKRETPRKDRTARTKPSKNPKTGGADKRVIFGLVERGGKARTFHINQATAWEVRKIIVRHVSRKSDLHTDEARIYSELGKEFDAHKTVIHSKYEYVRGNVHTNTVESVWSVFKRGMKGIYQHCGEAHLHRYLAEFDFRYNTELPPGVFVYALKREAADGEPLHQICTSCYEQRKKSILHRSDRINGLTQITCNGCGKTLEEGRFHVPQNVSDYNPYDN